MKCLNIAMTLATFIYEYSIDFFYKLLKYTNFNYRQVMSSIYILGSEFHGWNKKKEKIWQVSRHHLTLRREEKGVIGFVIAKWTVQNYFTTFNSQS